MNKKPVILTSIATLAVLGVLGGLKYRGIQQQMAAHAAMVPKPSIVSVATVAAQDWPNSLVAVGSLASSQGITVKTELEGLVRSIEIASGAEVQAGTLLVRVDTSSEEAQLAGLEAQAKLAGINLKRAQELRLSNANTASDLDAAVATAAQAQASVQAMQVTISKKQIRAPFAGRLGVVKVHLGQFLAKGDAVVALESIQPIHADFSLPQQDLPLVQVGQLVQLKVDAFPDRVFEARVSVISPRVDDATRMLDLRATLGNEEALLRPGMFARVEVVRPVTKGCVVVPATAVSVNPYGSTVYVVEGGRATQRFITTGASRGDLIQVLSGLKAGDVVVTSGQLKLRNGSAVEVDNSMAPDANPAPTPVES